MKGYEVRTLVFGLISLAVAGYLTFLGQEPSWSQNAGTALWFLLNVVLISIAESFSQIAAHSPWRNNVQYKWLSVNIRVQDLARFVQYSFYCILVFHLESSILPEWMHMLATGISVAGLYFMVISWYGTYSSEWYFFVSAISFSVLALILAFGFKLYEVGYGEYALAITGFIFQRKII